MVCVYSTSQACDRSFFLLPHARLVGEIINVNDEMIIKKGEKENKAIILLFVLISLCISWSLSLCLLCFVFESESDGKSQGENLFSSFSFLSCVCLFAFFICSPFFIV